MGMDEIARTVREKVSGSAFNGSVKFDCGSDGVIVIESDSVSTQDAPADCVISLAKSDLVAMLAGELNPASAMMQGKLRIDGDLSVAMRLSQTI